MSLSVRNISKKIYGRNVVNDVSFNVKRGEVVGLLGPNGAGKSTSFYITAGLTNATMGSIYLDDQDISNSPAYKSANMFII
jgi:lipopolysaccharide export system ATP-binding protein